MVVRGPRLRLRPPVRPQIAAPRPVAVPAALPAELQHVIPAALAADEQHLKPTRMREEAEALRSQATQATQAVAAQTAVAQAAADDATAAAQQLIAELERTRAVRATDLAIAEETLDSAQTAARDIDQAAAARIEAAATAATAAASTPAFIDTEAAPTATAHQAFQIEAQGHDDVSWSRLGPADSPPEALAVDAPTASAPTDDPIAADAPTASAPTADPITDTAAEAPTASAPIADPTTDTAAEAQMPWRLFPLMPSAPVSSLPMCPRSLCRVYNLLPHVPAPPFNSRSVLEVAMTKPPGKEVNACMGTPLTAMSSGGKPQHNGGQGHERPVPRPDLRPSLRSTQVTYLCGGAVSSQAGSPACPPHPF